MRSRSLLYLGQFLADVFVALFLFVFAVLCIGGPTAIAWLFGQ